MATSKAIAEFLQKQPLYTKIEIDTYFFHPDRFYDLTFQFHCPTEGSLQTFKLIQEPEKLIKSLGSISSDRFTNFFDPYQEDKSIRFVQHFSGECQYCKSYKIDFLLNVFSNGPILDLSLYNRFTIPSDNNNEDTGNKQVEANKLFIRKIGQFPPFEINPEKDVINFFQEPDKEFYKKALICLSQSFGIGAYSYLRRITENEILRIVEALSEISTSSSEKIKQLYETYKTNKQMNNLIEGIYQYLPPSLKSLGINPLKVLYGHLSGGIHSDSEETCLQKAFGLDTVLRFTIKKLNEEKYELKEIRDALKILGH